MLISGSVCDKSGKRYHFNKDQIIEAPKGSFDECYAEAIIEKKTRKTSKNAETAQLKIDSEKADA